jgi:murein DD-endopeptidase MepM/ murein hydrolase activator NlpD
MPRYDYPGYKFTGEGWLGARPGTKCGYHGGTDNPAAAGTPVYAEHGGKVFRSGPISGYGMSVIVKSIAADGTPFYELYGHLGPGRLPPPDSEVVAGKPIPGAVIGETEYVRSKGGISSGPHLHRETISGKVRLNPNGGLGLYSSEINHKADPDTFDINHPVFPYENGEPLPPAIPQAGHMSGSSSQRPA